MSTCTTRPRILFVTPEAAFNPKTGGHRKHAISTNAYGFYHFPVALISDLFHYHVDVYVAQPDYSRLFPIIARNEHANSSLELPIDHLYLAKDRAFSYANLIELNPEWENIKVSLAFQREVIHQIIPRVQPDLIHCHDWMTGLIPAAAKKLAIPCLFTILRPDSARISLSYVEDIGIDAAGFWQNLFYVRYPGSYEQTRETNPLDLLLSGILSASHVNTVSPALLPNAAGSRSHNSHTILGQVLDQKYRAGCATTGPTLACPGRNLAVINKSSRNSGSIDPSAGHQESDLLEVQTILPSANRTPAKIYMDLYEMLLQRPLVPSNENKAERPHMENNSQHEAYEPRQHFPHPFVEGLVGNLLTFCSQFSNILWQGKTRLTHLFS